MKVEFTEWYNDQPITIDMSQVVAVRRLKQGKMGTDGHYKLNVEGAIITTLHGAEFIVTDSYQKVLDAWPPREQVMVKHIPTSGE